MYPHPSPRTQFNCVPRSASFFMPPFCHCPSSGWISFLWATRRASSMIFLLLTSISFHTILKVLSRMFLLKYETDARHHSLLPPESLWWPTLFYRSLHSWSWTAEAVPSPAHTCLYSSPFLCSGHQISESVLPARVPFLPYPSLYQEENFDVEQLSWFSILLFWSILFILVK